MYDKYFLEKDQLDTISNWLNKNEPLFISGGPGSGKTSLAKEILNDRVITHIDALYMKNNSDIGEYIQNIIQKRNITMMFSQNKEKRGIIIDDIDIFYKHDKKAFKSIINLLLNSDFCDTKIIITSSIKFLNNRSLKKLKYSKLFIIYSNHAIHKICKNICDSYSFNTPLVKKKELIRRSSTNINLLISLLESGNKLQTQALDNFEGEDILYNKLFTIDYTLKDLIRIYKPFKTKISLDLLENLFNITTDIKFIKDIYNYCSLSDIFETKCINYSDIQEYDIILTIYNFYYRIRETNITMTTFIPNKYVSKSLIHTCSHKMNFNSDIFYFYLYLIKINKQDNEIVKELTKLDKKQLTILSKTFNYYYDSKIKVEKIYKLVN